jgi:F-type H+-transporting ATPase subunit gamma
MPSLKDVRKRIQSVKNTQKVTSAMKMVSAAKLRRAQLAIESSRSYALKMMDVMRSLALRTSPEAHPLLAVREPKKIELIIITSDRGLCGSFNMNVIKKAESFIREKQQDESEVWISVIGRKARDYFRRRNYNIRESHIDILRTPQYSDCVKIASNVMDEYVQEKVDEVWVCCNTFVSVIRQAVILDRLLPIPPMEVPEEEMVVEYLYEPSEEALLDKVLPENVVIQMWRCFLESVAAEHAARMTSMDSATNNAGEMIDQLTLIYNRTRQAFITKELMDIVGGAEALKG